ncbi:Endonuclease/exonuclease/phosphatase [Obba rivulosa]|uniref:Endonuclease/exonuclease/phosphatase n=1 Tax=Obba rivulosa TaxID=1052685 RepID=A0A8E2DU02_9APHY|nr:Endonuclease/exonuclease/phosphatase [Obba rivulosa]
MPKGFQPTSEQLAIAEERKRKKAERAKNAALEAAREEEERGRFLKRDWLDVQMSSSSVLGQRVRVMTWNLLAQCLVRRELFPTSDCLKASQREHMLYREILSHNADIYCLQEVDRVEKLLPILEKAGYSTVFKAGPRKKHGCLIAFDKGKYTCSREAMVLYDEQPVRDDGSNRARVGSSFRTKNVANLVALRRSGTEDGVIVATTHLFWHPSVHLTRDPRQAYILLREIIKFRDADKASRQWPCIIAGDFNFQPDDPAYSLLVGESLTSAEEELLARSRVVHVTIDPDVPITSTTPAEEEEGAEGAETDPDRVITNARLATPEDGLLTTPELTDLFSKLGTLKSAYDEGQRMRTELAEQGLTFGSRMSVPSTRHGTFEPNYTSYTHYWKTVLDYIFVLSPPDRPVSIEKLAKPHPANAFGLGLPRKGVCGSDHISLAAEMSWPAT